MMKIICFAFISFMFIISSVSAQLWTSDFSGTVKRTFYNTNDSVYLSSNMLFTPTTTLKVYIVNDNNTWVNASVLTDVRGNYLTVITNSSGAIDKRDIWDPAPNVPLLVGKFDIVIDLNSNGVYDNGTCGTNDCVYSLTETGFEVLKTPQPVITAGYGSYNPVDHNWAYDPTNPNNVMMNLKLTGDVSETVKLTAIYLSASGSGNDKTGISFVKIVSDDNNNGLYDSGDTLRAWGGFLNDDGIATLSFQSSINLPANGTTSFLIVYTMSTSVKNEETYSAKVLSVEGTGENTKITVSVNNLPLATAKKTMIASPYQTTTTSTSSMTTTTTTILPKDECVEKEDCKADYCSGKKQYTYSCEYSEQEKRKVCKASTETVGCCDDADCKTNEQCENYVCKKKPTVFGTEMMTIIIFVVVIAVVFLTAFFYLKSKRKKPEYEYGQQRYS